MNAHARINLDVTCFTVFCDGEIHTFTDRKAVEHHLSGTFGQPFEVVEWNAAEGSANQVTLDFILDDEGDEPDGDYCAPTVLRPVASAWRR